MASTYKETLNIQELVLTSRLQPFQWRSKDNKNSELCRLFWMKKQSIAKNIFTTTYSLENAFQCYKSVKTVP